MAHQVHIKDHRKPLHLRHPPTPEQRTLQQQQRKQYPRLHQAQPPEPNVRHEKPTHTTNQQNRQSKPRVSQQHPPKNQRNTLHHHKNKQKNRCPQAPNNNHHIEQRKRTTQHLPTALRVPLHQVPQTKPNKKNRQHPPPEPQHHTPRPNTNKVLLAAQPKQVTQKTLNFQTNRLDHNTATLKHHSRPNRNPHSLPKFATQKRTGHPRRTKLRKTKQQLTIILKQARAQIQPITGATTIFLDLFYGLHKENVPISIQK